MFVEDLMTRRPASVQASGTLAEAAELMWKCDCGVLPVVEGAENKLVGMITDRDICMATWSRGRPPAELCVRDVMAQNPITCHPRDSIARAEAILRVNQIRRLPVTDPEGHLRGILSLADLARAADSAAAFGPLDGLSSVAVATTLATICRNAPVVVPESRGIP